MAPPEAFVQGLVSQELWALMCRDLVPNPECLAFEAVLGMTNTNRTRQITLA